eukprot:CAMPEP_0206148314 /NCGR_PEP_ID=MMETSP1473-20131121/36275_1 /ASSEMBLY_ACC=CAM_ASM_001109 /TAXON_ID=1461547 /ORGANISM="Stichococcus sp, Strain RCC1054" /LENGTH=34 /DNA_ID= /DNA_START= /DNA_END= /DNA_ORIENTATION=
MSNFFRLYSCSKGFGLAAAPSSPCRLAPERLAGA